MGARDYSLTGDSARRAMAVGLASAEWYHSDIPRAKMKELMRRSDGPAIRDTLLWFGLLAIAAAGGVYFWGSWASVPFFLMYGVLYGSASDSRWHECGHGTAFKTRWMNDAVYEIASFMVMRNSVVWRWSHARHHTDTVIVGRDPEIAVMRPPSLAKIALNFVGLPDVWSGLGALVRQAGGKLSADERNYVPASEQPKAVAVARAHVSIYAATLLAALALRSWLPLMVIGGPRIYGCWHMVMVGLLQHGGLADDVLDHRLNSRTVYMNPLSRFVYWNMNYHVEHHMFPMVPFHALPRLHALIKTDLPPANPSIFDAYREMIPAILKQRRDPTFYVRRKLPETARPYREDFHEGALGLSNVA
jgi:fatty acid desaturase